MYCDAHNTWTISSFEKELIEVISTIYTGTIIHTYRKLGKHIDIFLPDLNIGIEFNGLYWHNDQMKTKTYHYDKWKLCNDNGIKLITIWEDDWNIKKNVVKSILTNQIGVNLYKIYARKTIIKDVSPSETKEFLENNHIQGWCQSSIRLGLYLNDELVSLMTFGKRTLGKNTQKIQHELLRFCNRQNTSVVGGASKLFKHFINNYNPSEVVTYANLDISNGDIYNTLGFNNLGHTGLNYWWVKDKRYPRNKFMKHKLVKDGADPNLTENEIMYNNGYNKIYGNGNIKFKKVF